MVRQMDNVKFDQTVDDEKSSTFNLEAEQALLGLLLVNNEVLGEIETLIGTKINSIELYQRAFTHKSALKRYNLEHSFELLEFIGDSVLNFVITRYLFDKFSDRDEGFLTKLRTRLVRGKTLSDVGRKLELNKYVIMDEKGDRNGWANNDNILVVSSKN